MRVEGVQEEQVYSKVVHHVASGCKEITQIHQNRVEDSKKEEIKTGKTGMMKNLKEGDSQYCYSQKQHV